MALLCVIRRWHFREHLSIREICRRTGLSRNTIRKYLRAGGVEPKFNVPDRPSKLDPFADRLSAWLKTESKKSRKQKRTMKQLHVDLVSLGYEGSYNRVAAFAREWRDDRQRELQTTGRGTSVPLAFEPGEPFQFDWSEDWAIIGNERTKLQIAHTKLSYSRAFIVRAHILQTHEMLFDAHNHAFRVFAGIPGRGDREMVDNLALVLQHDEQAAPSAVDMALKSGVPTKTHVLNLLHRLVDGKSFTPPTLDAPQALTLTNDPKANVERYDALRKTEARHAS